MKRSRIFLAAFWISNSISFGLLLTGCVLTPTESHSKSYSPKEKVYFQPYDEVWRATQLAFAHYPIKMNNMDLGIIETDHVKGDQIWSAPHSRKESTMGVKYQITARIIAGTSKHKKGTKVSIFKKVEKQRDFFAQVEKLPSDGLEEMSLLYRIDRELKIEHALQKLQKRENQ
ncbi:MAG: hypothetical protein KDD61_00870 [Bdellovibrionales bacterium]|nr:hypothetical protein [Bdellovibrionales bacterium]